MTFLEPFAGSLRKPLKSSYRNGWKTSSLVFDFFKKHDVYNKCITAHKGMYEKHLTGKEKFQGLVRRAHPWESLGYGANSRCKFISLLPWPGREERTGTL